MLGEPVRLDPTAGYVPGLGDGSAVAVIDTPLVPAGGEENGPTSVSGIGVRSSDGSIDWVVAPPSTPTVGPTTTWATVSEDWVVWLQTATSEPYDMAETLWAVPRSGGTPREIDRSVAAAVATVHGVQAYEPVVRGGWVLWYDEPADAADAPLYTPVSGTPVVMAAPLDGSGPARVLVPDATGMFADLCSDDPHAFYAGEGATSGPPSLHRIVLADDGSIASDEVVRADLTGAAEDTWDAGACGDTVAVAHDVDRENADRGAWVEVDHGGDVQSFVFPEGTGSSVADLTVGPRLVTWAMDNGGDEGARYLLDLADGTLYALPTTPGFAHVAANSLIVQWRENPTQEDADARDVLAPILAP